MKDGFEIERKFLIEYPDISVIGSLDGVRITHLEQCYLEGGDRVRKITENGKTHFIKTVKKHITDIKREEKEWEISEEEYLDGVKGLARGTSVIAKTRYIIPCGGLFLEVDVFPFWQDRAFLEIELSDQEQEIVIPDFLNVIKEVTSDKRYRNSSLAREIFTEALN